MPRLADDIKELAAHGMELVEHLGKPLVFAVNGAAPRARITAEAVALLSQYGPLAPSIIHQRVDFAAAMIDGRTVMELPGESRSADEIAALWSYLSDRLEGGVAQRRRLPAIPRRVVTMTPQTKAEGRA